MKTETKFTTIETLTYEQIRALRDEAATAGDLGAVTTCDRALLGDETARETVVEWINASEAMQ